jgi:thioredoxin reductase (NADPH)
MTLSREPWRNEKDEWWEKMMYEALILGGGPAGLSAAVYLGRFTRRVVVLDAGDARSKYAQVNDNYLGFPDGVTTQDLRALGERQAQRFGAEIRRCTVERLEQRPGGDGFRAHTTDGVFEGRTLLFATGVTDVWPSIPGILDWIGRQVFWCITCDGHRAQNKQLVCIGNTDEAATTALQLLLFTDRITLVADPGKVALSEQKCNDLAAKGVPLLLARPNSLELSPSGDSITAVCLDDGTRLSCELIFSLLSIRPNTQMAREIGVALDEDGYIVMDEEGYTSVPGVFAAGDLTRMYTQQVASAVHAGAEAAQTMNYYLYPCYQKNLEDVSPQEGYDPTSNNRQEQQP